MVDDIRHLIDQYTMELSFLQTRYLTERKEGRAENESYFFGQWCKLGNVICDLKGRLRKHEDNLKTS